MTDAPMINVIAFPKVSTRLTSVTALVEALQLSTWALEIEAHRAFLAGDIPRAAHLQALANANHIVLRQ